MHIERRGRWPIAVALLIAATGIACAEPTGALRSGGIEVQVRSLGYDEAASFYIARGLPQPLVERYARPCVVVVVLSVRDAAHAISVSLSQWKVTAKQTAAMGIRGRSAWLTEFDREGVQSPARMAFEWAQFPEEARLNPGDAVQGMLSLPIGRGSPFDLIVRWQALGVDSEVSIGKVQCE